MFYISDVHVDIWEYYKQELPHEAFPDIDTDVAILAGDIGELHAPCTMDYVVNVAQCAKHVLWIPGNHEFYGTTFNDKPDNWAMYRDNLPNNVHWMNMDTLRLNGFVFIAAPLWSYIPPHEHQIVRQRMNDYMQIRVGHEQSVYGTGRRLNPQETVQEHFNTIDYFKLMLPTVAEDDIPIVVTHHKPIWVRREGYPTSILDYAYMTDMTLLMQEYEIPFWFHGHTHENYAKVVPWGDAEGQHTMILTNALGYPMETLNHDFEAKYLEIEV